MLLGWSGTRDGGPLHSKPLSYTPHFLSSCLLLIRLHTQLVSNHSLTQLQQPPDMYLNAQLTAAGTPTPCPHPIPQGDALLPLQVKAVRLISSAEALVYDDLGTQVGEGGCQTGAAAITCEKHVHVQTCAHAICRHVSDYAVVFGSLLTGRHVLPQELLSTVQPNCELHYVGKRGGQPSIKQQDIDKLLVTLCKQVRSVQQHVEATCVRRILETMLHHTHTA
jgi:hypothetical protein